MSMRRPASLRVRLLAGLFLVVTIVIVVFDLATVTALRDWQIRRLDGVLGQAVDSHGPRVGELLAASRRQQPVPSLTPDDYYLAVVTDDRRIVTVMAPRTNTPRLPVDLADLARSGQTRTVTGTDGSAFRLRAVRTEAGILVAAADLQPVTEAIHQLQIILALATIAAMAMLALCGLLVIRRAVRPLEAMAAQADRITAGDLTRPVAPHTPHTEVGRLGLALNRMLTRIRTSIQEQQAAQEQTRQFFADASHELRTPLTSLRVNAELYEQGALTSRAQVDEAMRRIRVSAHRMGDLVDDMLRLARLDQQPHQRTDPVDVSDLLTRSIRDAHPADGERTLRSDIQPGLVVRGDEALLRRAIDNVLANVRVHTSPRTTITINARRHGDHIHIDVDDDGPGVPQHALPHLFDRFYRADHTTTGSGLGLAIVAEVAARHGGNATAHAIVPHGLRIQLTLPSGEPRAAPHPQPVCRRHQGGSYRTDNEVEGQSTHVADPTRKPAQPILRSVEQKPCLNGQT